MTTTTIKTILTLESVLQRVKEIGIAARHETYAAIADRIFLTPACIEGNPERYAACSCVRRYPR